MLGQHYTMPEAISTNITGSGFKRCAQTLMWNHVCLVDAVVKLIAVMFLLILHQNTTAALFPFHYSTTCFQKWIHISALTSKQHCLGCLLYYRSCYLSLEKSALLNSLSLLKCDLPSPDCIETSLLVDKVATASQGARTSQFTHNSNSNSATCNDNVPKHSSVGKHPVHFACNQLLSRTIF